MKSKLFYLISVLCLFGLMIMTACEPMVTIPGTGSSSSETNVPAIPTNTPSVVPTLMVPEVATSSPGVSGDVPTQAPAGAPGVVITSAPGENITVTPENQGQTLKLKVGQSFLLKLGEEYTWSPIVADQNIVSRVKNIAVIRGAQGIYQANAAGQTTLTAAGEPVCRQSQPPCAMPNRQFSINLVVEP